MASVVYRVEHGYVTIAGVGDVPVAKFHLSLAQNGIPTLQLELDPVHVGEGSASDGDPSDANTAEFLQMYSRYVSIFNMIELPAGATASFYFLMLGTNGDTQALDLKDWVITDVGIGSFTYSSRLAILLTLSHPAVRLNDGGMYFVGAATDPSDKAPENGGNVLEAAVNNLAARAKAGVVTGQPESVEKVMKLTEKLIATIPQVIEWSPETTSGKWPAMGLLDSVRTYAIYNAIASIRHVTPWEFISRELVNHWFLSLRPTYWKETLELGPHNPWASALITLQDTDIAATSVPSSGDRLSGVINASLIPALIGTTAAQWHKGTLEQYRVAQAHIEDIAGPVIPTNIPSYLASAVEAYLKGNSSSLGDSGRENFTANTPGQVLEAFATEIAEPLHQAMLNVCKQTFCNYYRQSVSTTLKTRLLLNLATGVDGAHIIPGFTCSVVSEGKPVMKFLVTAVDHVVDCNAATAYTVVAGAHVSPAGQPNLTAIPNGIVKANYVYGTV